MKPCKIPFPETRFILSVNTRISIRKLEKPKHMQTEEFTESTEETAAPETSHRATYRMDDDKLRLYVGRVPRDEYEALRADGWTSTPKQDCDFVAVWTPQREATAIRYAGIIEDEDMSPEERAADRAERFAGYRDRRTMESVGHADRYDSGPAVHGYQDYGRAVKAADRHDRIAGRAVNSWDKAEYWQMRTAGVISHALHKCSPGVRMGRIKELEADLRRIETDGKKAHARVALKHSVLLALVEHSEGKREKMIAVPGWQFCVDGIRRMDGTPDQEPLTTEQIRRVMISAAFSENYSGKWRELSQKAEKGEIEAVAVAREWLDAHGWEAPKPYDPTGGDWYSHITLRLAYERQMLEAQGGRAGELEIEVGGFFGGKQIYKVNKSPTSGRVVSVQVMGTTSGYTRESGFTSYETRPCLVTVEIERHAQSAYRAPTPEEKATFLAAQKAKKAAAPKVEKAPLINPTEEEAERLQAIWNERGKTEYFAMIVRHYGTTDHWNEYAAKSWKPATVFRITQAHYSEVSKGSYARAETRGLCRTGELEPQKYSNNEKKERERLGPTVCEIRTSGTDGSDFYGPRRVIVLTDKPGKPLPAAIWEAATVADLAAV